MVDYYYYYTTVPPPTFDRLDFDYTPATVCILYFLKPFFKEKIFAVEWERGKFDFDHYFAILTNFLKR